MTRFKRTAEERIQSKLKTLRVLSVVYDCITDYNNMHAKRNIHAFRFSNLTFRAVTYVTPCRKKQLYY
jgi:hypothetical protein